MKRQYPIKTCPWCGKTGSFVMYTPLDDTWLPRIKCNTLTCPVKPETRYNPIRKKQRCSPDILRVKIERVIAWWNAANSDFKFEGFELDYDEIAEKFKNGTIGMPGL